MGSQASFPSCVAITAYRSCCRGPPLEVPHRMLQWFQIVKFRTSVTFALLTFLLCRFTSQAQEIVINEIMTSNTRTVLDENGDSSDWLELYNAGPTSVSLAGYGLSDDPAFPFKWTFRDAAIGPGSFLFVFASGKDRQPGASPPTNPPAIAGLKVWLRADAVATNDPTQARASSGTFFVRRWNDRSGAANPAQQTTEDLQPRYSPAVAAFNNQPALHFDGVNDLLTLPTPP